MEQVAVLVFHHNGPWKAAMSFLFVYDTRFWLTCRLLANFVLTVM